MKPGSAKPTITPSDRCITPLWVVEPLKRYCADRNLRMHDTCTEAANPLGADSFWTEADDGRTKDWRGPGVYWCNPPYSRGQKARWVELCGLRARTEKPFALLLPSDTSASWFHEAASYSKFLHFFKRRLKFGIGSWSNCDGAGAKFANVLFTNVPLDYGLQSTILPGGNW